MKLKPCPICGTRLEPQLFTTIFIFYCPNCRLYFKQYQGKLLYPTIEQPKEYYETMRRTEPFTHDIGMFRKFLTQIYGLPLREYKRLREEEKEKIRNLYRQWLKTQQLRQESKRKEVYPEDEYISSGALKGLRRSEIPMFEKFLSEIGISLGDFYDQNPTIQRDLRIAFRRWMRGEKVIR